MIDVITSTMNKVWQRWNPDFKKVLPYPSADIMYGFSVDSNIVSEISWNTTYTDLLGMNLGQVITATNGIETYHFAYPVIIGSIKFYHLKITWDLAALNSPIKHYFIDINDSHRATHIFSQLVSSLTEYEAYAEKPIYLNSSGNPLLFTITIKDIIIKLTCCVPDKSISLEFINQRDYAYPILLSSHYQHQGVVSRFYHLGQGLKVARDLSYYDYCVKPVPSFVISACGEYEDNIVWIDELNQVIGFKGKQHCLIIPKNISRVRVDNLRPAKGIGGSWLYINIRGFKEDISPYSYQYPFTFDPYAKGLANFLGVEVDINDLGGDC